MVHLSAVHAAHADDADDGNATSATDKMAELADEAGNLLKLSSDADDFTTSVYGSRFAEQDLPRFKMPERAMPREMAYRMIKDDLSLDNNPKLK